MEFEQTLASHCNKYKKTKEAYLSTFILFIDYENGYDNIQQILIGDKILARLLLAINSLYRIKTIKVDMEAEIYQNQYTPQKGVTRLQCCQLFYTYT